MALLFAGPALSSRKRSVASSSAVASSASGSDSASKRLRRLLDSHGGAGQSASRASSPSSFSVDTVDASASPPPSLEASTTFDSSVTDSPSLEDAPSLPSPRLALANVTAHHVPNANSHDTSTPIDNDAAAAGIAHHTNEYYTAISAAKSRLQTAQLLAANSHNNLSRAQLEFNRSRQEVHNAAGFLRGVETKWGVIDVDSDEVAVADVAGGSDGGVDGVGGSTLVSAGNDTIDTSDCSVRCIEVRQAGEPIVNGRYRLHPKGMMYVHEEGPFTFEDESYDVCIFRKHGYGDKVRWCVGLVPCHLSDDENGGTWEDRRRNFALPYIYYWMEVSASHAPSVPPLDSSDGELPSWGACHGARPLPRLTDVTGRRWWQFWKR